MPAAPRRRTRAVEDDSDEDERPRQRRQAQDTDEDEDEDEDDDDHSPGSDQEVDEDGPSSMHGADQQLAKKLIRYAISCEYSRQPIRRDGIKERVLGNQGRSFRRIFALAQKQLRHVWGMEMQELPVREKMSLQEKRKALNSSSSGRIGSGAYILCSVLPPAYRTARILEPSKAPSVEAEATYTAFYTMVVSCIWLSGGELSDQKLKRHLLRLNADRNVWAERTEMVLKKMERQGYVIRRVDRPPVGQDGESTVTWHVGTRAREEIGLDGVIGMVQEVYGEMSPELEKKLKSSLGIKDHSKPHENGQEAREFTNVEEEEEE